MKAAAVALIAALVLLVVSAAGVQLAPDDRDRVRFDTIELGPISSGQEPSTTTSTEPKEPTTAETIAPAVDHYDDIDDYYDDNSGPGSGDDPGSGGDNSGPGSGGVDRDNSGRGSEDP